MNELVDFNGVQFPPGTLDNLIYFQDFGYASGGWPQDGSIAFSYRNGTGSFNVNVAAITSSSVSVVPEPSFLAIFALGLFGLASRRFKKQS